MNCFVFFLTGTYLYINIQYIGCITRLQIRIRIMQSPIAIDVTVLTTNSCWKEAELLEEHLSFSPH